LYATSQQLTGGLLRQIICASAKMFERYNERARRALFFARYEASEIGGQEIETEHLLLGVLREGKGMASRVLVRSHLSLTSVRDEVASRVPVRDRWPTSMEIPFSAETKAILLAAAGQADRLGHHYIGPEHLLLGILDRPQSLAGMLLAEHGIDGELVRQEISELGSQGDWPPRSGQHRD
jgi:ATP-dependent Clp protease ATP-binding subunit ClpC